MLYVIYSPQQRRIKRAGCYQKKKYQCHSCIGCLNQDDVVKIFYSEDAETMTFGVHRRIIESRAKFEYCRIDSKIKYSVKNALDVLLLNDLTDTIKQHKMGEFYIVSKDSDYDYYIKSMHERKINIYKIDDKTKEQLFRSFFGRNLKNKYGEYKEEIVQAYMESRSRQELNNSLQIFFYNENVCEIMRVMQDYIKDMPGSIK